MSLLEQRKRRRQRYDSLLSAREEFRENRPDPRERVRSLLDAGENFVRSGVAAYSGTMGDMQGLLGLPQIIPSPTTEDMAERLGADLNTPSGLLGMIGMPEPQDMGPMAAKLLAGGKGMSLAQALFHGTPHKFDQFDLSKIGTGEGAQAYGHGLYFAENPGVAESYREVLSEGPRQIWKVGSKEVDMSLLSPYENHAIRGMAQPELYGGAKGKEKWLEGFEDRGVDSKNLAELSKAWDSVAARGGASLEEVPGASGHLYEVDIPDETIERMLK